MIEKENLADIENKASHVVDIINGANQWVNNYLLDEERVECRYALKKYRRQINKIKAVVSQKPTIALFGASQVGKSYMANNLLYNNNNKLEVYDHSANINIDFIKEINPEGKGNEATSAVTRFTDDTTPMAGSSLPVKVKLFDIKDVVCVLCDTYYNDFKDPKERVSKSEIIHLIEEIKKMRTESSRQQILTDDDIYLVKEYVEKYFKDNVTITELESNGYWDVLAENIEYISVNNWASCLNILWNGHEQINQVFDISLQFLKSLSYSREIKVSFDTLYRKSGAAIINVQTLQSFFQNDETNFEAETADGKRVSVKSSQLCFLTAEIVLCVSKGSVENRPFIKEVDIVDFPGARSRPEIMNLTNESLLEMMLRGKVSYLFNHYSSSFKTNVLVTCMRTQQTNVTSVPRLVNQWISDNLGNNAGQRGKNITEKIPPLFIIFTWWNTQLEFKKATDDPNPTERIEKLFEARFRQEIIGDYNWNDQWVEKEGKTDRFKNYFLLRDFKESMQIFNSADSGAESDSFKNPEQEDFHKKYFDTFVEYHNNHKKFFEDPTLNFLESSTPNKDGSMLIIENLKLVAKNEISTSIYINYLNEALRNVNAELNKHFHSDAADEQIKKAAREASELQLKMDIIFGKDAYYFGSFIEHLILKENEILSFYHELLKSDKLIKSKDTNTYILLRIQNPTLSPQISFNENLEILRSNYNQQSIEETKKHFTEVEKIDLNELFYGELYDLKRNSVVLAEFARDFWINQKLNHDHFQKFVDMGFEKTQLSSLFNTLKVSFSKQNVTKIIAESIRDYVDVQKKIDRAEEMIAHITAGIINKFVNTAGWGYFSEVEKSNIAETNEVNNLRLTIPEENHVLRTISRVGEEGEQSMSLDTLTDYMDNLTHHLSKKPIDVRAAKHVPMLNNYRKWVDLIKIAYISNCDIPTYNIEANNALGEILERVKALNFSLN